MKIKIATNIIHKGKILKKDEVHEVTAKEGDTLIDGGFATEHKEPEPTKPEEPPKK